MQPEDDPPCNPPPHSSRSLLPPPAQVAGQRDEAPTPQLPTKQGGPVTAQTATTTLVRPVAVRPALPAGAVAMCQSSSPRAMSGGLAARALRSPSAVVAGFAAGEVSAL